MSAPPLTSSPGTPSTKPPNGSGLPVDAARMPVDALAALSSVGGGYLPLRALQSSLISRYILAGRSGFNTQFVGKRDLNLILGYDEVIDIESFRYEYDRGGIAKRIVEIFPRATWGNGFEIAENADLKRKTQFEKSVDKFFKKHSVVQKLLRASILAYLGRYSVILIGAPGDPESPLPYSRNGINGIGYLYPLGEDKAIIESIVGQNSDEEASNPRYGMPEYYQINLAGSGNRNIYNSLSRSQTSPNFTRRVHWSRVIHIVRAPLDNEIVCSSILESVWNLLHDLKKLTGGLAEAALRRGWPGLGANVDKDAALTQDEKESIRTSLDEYNLGLTNGIILRKVALQATPQLVVSSETSTQGPLR